MNGITNNCMLKFGLTQAGSSFKDAIRANPPESFETEIRHSRTGALYTRAPMQADRGEPSYLQTIGLTDPKDCKALARYALTLIGGSGALSKPFFARYKPKMEWTGGSKKAHEGGGSLLKDGGTSKQAHLTEEAHQALLKRLGLNED